MIICERCGERTIPYTKLLCAKCYRRKYYKENKERVKKLVREYQFKNRERIYKNRHENYLKNKERINKLLREYRLKNQKAYKAQNLIEYFTKLGKIQKASVQLCNMCGKQAHHNHHPFGYEEKNALNVIPLCGSCHRKCHIITLSEAF